MDDMSSDAALEAARKVELESVLAMASAVDNDGDNDEEEGEQPPIQPRPDADEAATAEEATAELAEQQERRGPVTTDAASAAEVEAEAAEVTVAEAAVEEAAEAAAPGAALSGAVVTAQGAEPTEEAEALETPRREPPGREPNERRASAILQIASARQRSFKEEEDMLMGVEEEEQAAWSMPTASPSSPDAAVEAARQVGEERNLDQEIIALRLDRQRREREQEAREREQEASKQAAAVAALARPTSPRPLNALLPMLPTLPKLPSSFNRRRSMAASPVQAESPSPECVRHEESLHRASCSVAQHMSTFAQNRQLPWEVYAGRPRKGSPPSSSRVRSAAAEEEATGFDSSGAAPSPRLPAAARRLPPQALPLPLGGRRHDAARRRGHATGEVMVYRPLVQQDSQQPRAPWTAPPASSPYGARGGRKRWQPPAGMLGASAVHPEREVSPRFAQIVEIRSSLSSLYPYEDGAAAGGGLSAAHLLGPLPGHLARAF